MGTNWDSFPHFYLCNLQDVKDFLKGAGESVWDDSLLAPFVLQASADFAGELERLPLPYIGSFKADYAKGYVDETSRYLNLYSWVDTLSVMTVTNGDSQVIDSSYYTVDNANGYPKTMITMKLNSPVRFRCALDGNYQQVITVNGMFGYVPHYDYAWKAKTTITEAVSDTTGTSLTVAATTGLNIGDYLKIDSEFFLITAIASLVLTVERGALGTTAATHADNAPVSLFQQKADIKNAVREWAAYLWKTKDKIGEEITIYEGFTRLPKGLSPTVVNTVLRNRKIALDGLIGRFN